MRAVHWGDVRSRSVSGNSSDLKVDSIITRSEAVCPLVLPEGSAFAMWVTFLVLCLTLLWATSSPTSSTLETTTVKREVQILGQRQHSEALPDLYGNAVVTKRDVISSGSLFTTETSDKVMPLESKPANGSTRSSDVDEVPQTDVLSISYHNAFLESTSATAKHSGAIEAEFNGRTAASVSTSHAMKGQVSAATRAETQETDAAASIVSFTQQMKAWRPERRPAPSVLPRQLDVKASPGKTGISLKRGHRQASDDGRSERSWLRQQDPALPAGPETLSDGFTPHPHPSSTVRCETTTGPIMIVVHHRWAPRGAARFLEMVREGFFNTRVGLFRAVRGFICQTGIAGDPAVQADWVDRGTIEDDPQWLDLDDDAPMKRGYLSFAGDGLDSRMTEFFFAFRDLALGEEPHEVPFGELQGVESYEAMDYWYTGYGDTGADGGLAPNQMTLYEQGARYLDRHYKKLDFITSCEVLSETSAVHTNRGQRRLLHERRT
mmetsp:Transcript_18528/g.49712  ORF Transcript_18528/g.49712 Transcript_18528/m.49712 type:complete len:492 (-) Transcript_18528:294-1769(-)